MNRYNFLDDYAKPEFPITKGSHWQRNAEGEEADLIACHRRQIERDQVYPKKITIHHDEPNSLIPYSDPYESGWYVGSSCTISTKDILRYYTPDRLCDCGHVESEHADVPGITRDACWDLDCGCEKFHQDSNEQI